MQIQIESDAFGANGPIPKKHSGEGEDVSPALRWATPPAEAKQLALIVDDPDAPGPQPWVHWVIYNIRPDGPGLSEGIPAQERPPEPAGAAQGQNSWGAIGYGGPMPPPGSGPHHYHFRLYALDVEPTLEPGLTKDKLLQAVSEHVLATGELVGTYQRQ